jgi:hypothetical protein
VAESVGIDGVQPQLFEGLSKGSGKAGEGGDGPEISELGAVERRDSRGEGFADESSDGDELAVIELGGASSRKASRWMPRIARSQAARATSSAARRVGARIRTGVVRLLSATKAAARARRSAYWGIA